MGTLGCGNSSDDSDGDVLQILVTNDDGVGAEGIDVLVQALIADPNNRVIVSAPLQNQSGTGDATIEEDPSCGTGAAAPSSTASGYDEATWAVDGCPADAVKYALDSLYPDGPPHVVLSGINEGQNVGDVMGLLSQISGTVGAAKTAACAGVPALASSQGEGEVFDYPAGLEAVLQWLADHRADLLAGEVSVDDITSINIPSCDGNGEIRGTVEVPLATDNPDEYRLLGPQDCTSTLEDVSNDVEAFFNGYTTVTPVPRNTTCPGQ
jgi:5'-nucleotidase